MEFGIGGTNNNVALFPSICAFICSWPLGGAHLLLVTPVLAFPSPLPRPEGWAQGDQSSRPPPFPSPYSELGFSRPAHLPWSLNL